jgi:hypothetical protein
MPNVALPPSPAALRASTSPVKGVVTCALRPLHLSPGGRGRTRKRPGEGGTTALFLSSAATRCACKRGAATLTRRPAGVDLSRQGSGDVRVSAPMV